MDECWPKDLRCFGCGTPFSLREWKDGEPRQVWRVVDAGDGSERLCCEPCSARSGSRGRNVPYGRLGVA